VGSKGEIGWTYRMRSLGGWFSWAPGKNVVDIEIKVLSWSLVWEGGECVSGESC